MHQDVSHPTQARSPLAERGADETPSDCDTHFAAASPNVDMRLAREVVRVRLSMLRINELMQQGAFRVPIHLALGHEAIAVAVSAAMEASDRLLLTHRNIHYHLARSADLTRHIAEYRLELEGLSRGLHGAMNMTNPERGCVYTSSILGNCLVVAVGVAKARALTEPGSATFAVTGDGAMEEGAFYEALLMARTLRLPIVFLVENNQWAMYTRISDRRCAIDLRGLAAAFDVPFHALSGTEVTRCHERIALARDESVAERSPCIVEVALSTLGDRYVEEPGRPPRYVNYHHGPVAGLAFDADPVIEASDRDPLHVLAQTAGHAAWRSLLAAARGDLAELRA
jgi:TPP-dependent pyruvate/acetoin dehydrogenase alpha subunit